jgi:hypothetical protein
MHACIVTCFKFVLTHNVFLNSRQLSQHLNTSFLVSLVPLDSAKVRRFPSCHREKAEFSFGGIPPNKNSAESKLPFFCEWS